MDRSWIILLASIVMSQNSFSCEEEVITEEERIEKEVKSIQSQEERFDELKNFVESLPEVQDLNR